MTAKSSTGKDLGAASTCKTNLWPSASASSLEIGGLADDNAFAMAPPSLFDLSGKKHNLEWVNKVCSFVLTS